MSELFPVRDPETARERLSYPLRALVYRMIRPALAEQHERWSDASSELEAIRGRLDAIEAYLGDREVGPPPLVALAARVASLEAAVELLSTRQLGQQDDLARATALAWDQQALARRLAALEHRLTPAPEGGSSP